MKSGVYIHIPFCEQRCFYCAFTVAVTSEDTFAPYVDRVGHVALAVPGVQPVTYDLNGFAYGSELVVAG